MSTQVAPPPPPATLSKDGGDWDDHKLIHLTPPAADGNPGTIAICGFEYQGLPLPMATQEQRETMPWCPICVAVAKYDPKWRLPD